MSHLRTLVTLPVAAATAFLAGTIPATAAPVQTAPATAAVQVTPSPVLNVSMGGGCPEVAGLESIVAMQRINWIWAPLALDNLPDKNGDRKALPKVLVPRTMRVLAATAEWRARHDLVPGLIYTAPGPQPANQSTCTLQGQSTDGAVAITVTGTVVTIPTWLDALLPPIQPPAKV